MQATAFDTSSNTIESEHLPPIVPPPATAFRNYSTNSVTSKHSPILTDKLPSTPTKKYITKTMSTTTTIKKPINGHHVPKHGPSFESSRTISSESNKRVSF